jgi:hypothetical protein
VYYEDIAKYVELSLREAAVLTQWSFVGPGVREIGIVIITILGDVPD